MKKVIPLLVLLTSVFIWIAAAPGEGLGIGDKAPMIDYKMTGVDGKSYTLENVKQKNGLLVVYSCNTCPFVIAWEDRYNDLDAMCKEKGIGMVLVNSNEAKRGGDDSMEAMSKHNKKLGYTMPYVVDEKSKLANAFGARTTPHVFLFDSEMKLVYKGAIDDNYKDKDAVSKTYLQDALKNLSEGKPITPNSTKSIGCSIKRV